MHATNKRHAIDPDELQRLYLEDGWTMARLAARFAVGPSTIKRRLAKLRIAVRPQGPLANYKRTFVWSPELAYVVGAIATDGNLSGDGRHMSFVSKDPEWLAELAACLGRANAITTSLAHGRTYYRLQWGDRLLYDWLIEIGLTPAKSLTLGPLKVPDALFPDFLRGCIDGDGTVQTYTDRYLTVQNEKYVYQRLSVSLVSASPEFAGWIQAKGRELIGISGALFRRPPHANTKAMWVLKYSKKESLQLLPALYYRPGVPCLERKHQIALPFLASYG